MLCSKYSMNCKNNFGEVGGGVWIFLMAGDKNWSVANNSVAAENELSCGGGEGDCGGTGTDMEWVGIGECMCDDDVDGNDGSVGDSTPHSENSNCSNVFSVTGGPPNGVFKRPFTKILANATADHCPTHAMACTCEDPTLPCTRRIREIHCSIHSECVSAVMSA